MKELEINKNSWHFKFVTIFTNWNHRYKRESDICEYTTQFIKASIIFLVALAVGLLTAYALVDALMAIGFFIFTGFWLINPAGGVFLMVVLSLAAALGIFVLIEYINEFRMNRLDRRVNREPGIIKTMWDAHIGKYCVPIKFKDE